MTDRTLETKQPQEMRKGRTGQNLGFADGERKLSSGAGCAESGK